MCYRCQICDDVVPHNAPRRTHTVYREVACAKRYNPKTQDMEGGTRKEIAKEIPVCENCHTLLGMGASLATLVVAAGHRNRWEEAEVVAVLKRQDHPPRALRPAPYVLPSVTQGRSVGVRPMREGK